jgi:hypothetical protein
MKRYRENLKHRHKHLARQALCNAVARGKLKRGTCEVCGSKRTQGHHEDYSKPLEVRWLCREHHDEEHYEA